MKNRVKYIFLFLSLSGVSFVNMFSQEATVLSPNFQFQYIKNTDNERILETKMACSQNGMELPLSGMEISFFIGADKKDLIANIITDNKGKATLKISEDQKLKAESDGKWNFTAEFIGNDTIEAVTSEVAVQDVMLEMSLTMEDTIRTITVKGYTIDNGIENPVSGAAVNVFVPRMFRPLLIGELYLDDSGTATIEFPPDLPGDKEGNITLLATYADNTTYGNVEKRETLKWGLPIDYSVPVTHRALWTKTPPIWMIYTLSILLIGVWGHYLYAFISLVRIKRDAAKSELKS